MWSVCFLFLTYTEGSMKIKTARQCKPFCLRSQIIAPVLNYEKQQPQGKLNYFSKTISAFWIQALIQSSIRCRDRQRDRKKSDGWAEHKRTDGTTVMEWPCYACCYYQDFNVAVFKYYHVKWFKLMRTTEAAAYPLIQTILELHKDPA